MPKQCSICGKPIETVSYRRPQVHEIMCHTCNQKVDHEFEKLCDRYRSETGKGHPPLEMAVQAVKDKLAAQRRSREERRKLGLKD